MKLIRMWLLSLSSLCVIISITKLVNYCMLGSILRKTRKIEVKKK